MNQSLAPDSPTSPSLVRPSAAIRAFLRAVDPESFAPASPRPSGRGAISPEAAYRAARRDHARALRVGHPDAPRLRLPMAPRLTVADDCWALEAWNAEASTYARLAVDRDPRLDGIDRALGTTRVNVGDLAGWVDGPLGSGFRPSSGSIPPNDPPLGWARGLAAVLGTLALPAQRVPVDRGGLLGLLGAIGRELSVVVAWEPGRPAWAEVGERAVALHARMGVEGSAGAVRVAAGSTLTALGEVLPEVEGAELLVDPTGSVTSWAVRLAGGVRLLVAGAAWTLDGRLGALRVDAAGPPIEAGRFLLNQVVASFRDRPIQTRREVVERTRGNAPAVLAALYRLAASGLILPEPEQDRLRWRPEPAPEDGPGDDPEPAEVAAARAIARTESIRVEHDEPLLGGRGRRVDARILDRPTRAEFAPDGWLRRGSCTCSHHEAARLARGPCRHLLALQARVVDGLGATPSPTDLAAWHAALGGST